MHSTVLVAAISLFGLDFLPMTLGMIPFLARWCRQVAT